jgi:hypothetical protein
MILKIFKSLWFLSLIALLASLLYVYAWFSDVPVVVLEDGLERVELSRESFFYIILGFATLVNSMVYLIKVLRSKDEALRSWFHGLVITINLFTMVGIFLINAFNSGERFDFARIGFAVYGSLMLVVLWAVAWPVFQLYKKFTIKSSV